MLKRLSPLPAVVLSALNLHCGDEQCTVFPLFKGTSWNNHPAYLITIPSLIIFKLISKTRAI